MPCRWWCLTPWRWWRLSPWRWIIKVGGALWCGTLGFEGHGILMMRLLLLGVVGFHLHTVEEFFMAHGGAIKVDVVLRVLHARRGVVDVALDRSHPCLGSNCWCSTPYHPSMWIHFRCSAPYSPCMRSHCRCRAPSLPCLRIHS